MKVELKKVNNPDGSYWYGIWVDGSCEIPAYGTDLARAEAQYNLIIENLKDPKPKYETIKSETV